MAENLLKASLLPGNTSIYTEAMSSVNRRAYQFEQNRSGIGSNRIGTEAA